jgi:hypothetical protein
MVNRDELTSETLIIYCGGDLNRICLMTESIKRRIKELAYADSDNRLIHNSEIDRIIKIGGLGIGGINHIEGRIFNHALGYMIEEATLYHTRELSSCIKQYLEHDQTFYLNRDKKREMF